MSGYFKICRSHYTIADTLGETCQVQRTSEVRCTWRGSHFCSRRTNGVYFLCQWIEAPPASDFAVMKYGGASAFVALRVSSDGGCYFDLLERQWKVWRE